MDLPSIQSNYVKMWAFQFLATCVWDNNFNSILKSYGLITILKDTHNTACFDDTLTWQDITIRIGRIALFVLLYVMGLFVMGDMGTMNADYHLPGSWNVQNNGVG